MRRASRSRTRRPTTGRNADSTSPRPQSNNPSPPDPATTETARPRPMATKATDLSAGPDARLARAVAKVLAAEDEARAQARRDALPSLLRRLAKLHHDVLQQPV